MLLPPTGGCVVSRVAFGSIRRVWGDFVHDTDEVVMVVEGEVELEIAGVTHRPRAGKELLIPAGARHTVGNLGTTESRWLYGYGRGKASDT